MLLGLMTGFNPNKPNLLSELSPQTNIKTTSSVLELQNVKVNVWIVAARTPETTSEAPDFRVSKRAKI